MLLHQQQLHFQGSRHLFSFFFWYVFLVFFWGQFLSYTMKNRVWSAKYSTFGASCVLDVYQKTWFLGKKRSTRELKIYHHVHDNFLKSSPLPHDSHDLGGLRSEQNWKNELSFVWVFLFLFVVYLMTFFWQKLISQRNPSFFGNKTDFFACTASCLKKANMCQNWFLHFLTPSFTTSLARGLDFRGGSPRVFHGFQYLHFT